ncbi:MAG: type II toxin-antitoxin system PrlF family antitoxin [bacterium]
MTRSKLTIKYQATIPKEVRSVLDVKPGDRIVFEVLPDKSVVLRKEQQFDPDYLRSLSSTLSEWDGECDEEDYKDL